MPCVVRIHASAACGLSLCLWAANPVWAHPGHGPNGGDHSLLHYLSTPEHLALGAIIGCAALLCVWAHKQMAHQHEARASESAAVQARAVGPNHRD